MTTNASETNLTGRVPDNAVIIIIDFIFICTGAIGAFANILIIYVICRTRSLRTSMNANLVSLSVADLIVCVFFIPVRLILYNIDNTAIWSIKVLCRIDVFLKTMCDSAQLFMLVATSFERYQSIARPFEKQGHGKRTVISLTTAWLLSVGLGIFNSLYCGDGGSVYPCYDQNHQIFSGHWGDKEKNITLPVGLMCLFMVVIFYGRIMKLLNEHNTSMQKRFKTKVRPAEKITEKSTSNAVLKINSTVHVPIPLPGAAKTIQPKEENVPEPNQTGHNPLQNGIVNIHKSAIVEDSGYNEPEHTARNSELRLENDNGNERPDASKEHKPDHVCEHKDGNKGVNEESVKYFNNLSKEKKNIQTLSEGDSRVEVKSPLASWRRIINGRIFNTHTEKESIERIPDRITVLNVRETKRFPLIRERATLAKLETSRAEKAKQKNDAQSSVTQRNRGTVTKARSASDIYQNNISKRNQTSKPTHNSLSALRSTDKSYLGLAKTGGSHVHPTKTSNVCQHATSSSTQNCDTFDAGKPHLTALRKVSRVIMSLMPISDSDDLSNRAVTEVNETQGQSSDRTGITTCTAGEHNDVIKLPNVLKENAENKDKQQTNDTILFRVKPNSNDTKESPETAQLNTPQKESKQNEVVSWKAKIKKDSLQRVEVVEMDGTVHKKVKVESGAVVGAVCVMNNTNKVQGRRKVEMRTAKNIAILIGTFILLWLPLPVVVMIISSSLDISKVSVEPVLIIASASSLTVALNPILNVLLNKQMRSRTITTLKNCKSKIR